MTARQLIVPGAMPSRDRNGRALPAKLRFYAPNTTNPATVYTSNALSVAHTFPILSDSAGRWPAIWADDANSFDVAWSDQTFDKPIATYAAVTPANDAVLASVALAQAAADTAVANGTTDNAAASAASAAAAAASATAAAASATAAGTSATAGAGSAAAAAGSASAASASASSAATSASNAAAIVGFDPTAVHVTGGGLATGGGDVSADRTITVTKSSQAQAEAGTDDATAMTPLRTADAITAQVPGLVRVAPDVIMRASSGGPITQSAWNDVVVDTTDRNAGSLAALASSQITLPAGTYYAKAKVSVQATATGGAATQARLFNVTDNAVVGSAGMPVYVLFDSTDNASGGVAPEVTLVFTLAASKALKLQVFGPAGVGANEIAAFIEIWKVG